MDDDTMSFDEVIEHIMRVTGKTRRQARAELIGKVKGGELAALRDDKSALTPAEVELLPWEH